MHIQSNTDERSCDRCCSGRAISIIYSECVLVALGIRHATRVLVSRHLWSVRLWQYFPTLSYERYDFRKQIIEHKIFVLTFSTTFV